MKTEPPWMDLAGFLQAHGVAAKFHAFPAKTTTVEEAMTQLRTAREKIVKSIVLIDERGEPVIGMVCGHRRVSFRKLAAAAGVRSLRLARADEVYHYTGFPVGGTPPVGHKIRVRCFVDDEVLTHDSVIGGGGGLNVLVEISPRDIVRLTGAVVTAIAHNPSALR